jgi:hypothetical protein
MILCSGCSFTIGSHKDDKNNDIDYKHWPVFLPTVTKNVAIGGAGNRLIARTILDHIDDPNVKAVAVMWSTVERYDWYMPEFNAYKPEGASYTGAKQNYLKYFYTEFNQLAKTLEYILLVQQTCKVRNKPYVFMHMGDMRYNDWDMDRAYRIQRGADGTGARRSLDLSTGKTPVLSFEQKLVGRQEQEFIKKLKEQIDWSRWIFYKDHGGLWQFTNDGGYDWIAYHPPEQAHKDWTEQMVNPRLKELNIIY